VPFVRNNSEPEPESLLLTAGVSVDEDESLSDLDRENETAVFAVGGKELSPAVGSGLEGGEDGEVGRESLGEHVGSWHREDGLFGQVEGRVRRDMALPGLTEAADNFDRRMFSQSKSSQQVHMRPGRLSDYRATA